MKLKELKLEELELMTYDDIAHMILSENGKKMKIQTLFKKVCDLLNLNSNEFEDKIADFFELLSTDKRFIMLPKGYWDLRINHTQKMVIIEDDDEELPIETAEDPEENKDDEIFYDEEAEDEADDDLQDLVVIDSEAEEVEEM